jgi:dipeptidyl-peptidase 4
MGWKILPMVAAGRNETNVEKEKNKNSRKPVFVYWSPDSKHFALVRTDNRKVKDLWVINSVAEPRPTLETYKYHMPGEKEAPIRHLYIFNMSDTSRRIIDAFSVQRSGTRFVGASCHAQQPR